MTTSSLVTTAIYVMNGSDGGDIEYETGSVPYPGRLKQVSAWEAAIKIILYVVAITVGIVGNMAVVVTVCCRRSMHTTTNFYLVNLAVSDLAVTLSCSWVHLVADLSEGWILGWFFCKANSFIQVLSLVSSVLTLTLLACDRFFGIVFALEARLAERRSWLFILIIWIISGLIAMPLLFYRSQFTRRWLDHTEVWCADSWPYVEFIDPDTYRLNVVTYYRTNYYLTVTVVLFFVPMIVTSLAYAAVVYRLWTRRNDETGFQLDPRCTSLRIQVKKRVVKMLVIVVASFVLCHLPFQVSILYSEFRSSRQQPLPMWYNNFKYAATYLAHFHSTLNPLIYISFNRTFRNGFIETFQLRTRHETRSHNPNNSMTNTVELRPAVPIQATRKINQLENQDLYR